MYKLVEEGMTFWDWWGHMYLLLFWLQFGLGDFIDNLQEVIEDVCWVYRVYI